MHGWSSWPEISQLWSHFFGCKVLRGNSRASEKYHKVVKDQPQLQVGGEDLIQQSPFTALRGNRHFLENLLLCNLFWNWNCYWKAWVDLAAHCSKANKQVKLVERKICFISDGSNWRGRGDTHLSKGWLPLPSPGHQLGKNFYRQKLGDRRGSYMQ